MLEVKQVLLRAGPGVATGEMRAWHETLLDQSQNRGVVANHVRYVSQFRERRNGDERNPDTELMERRAGVRERAAGRERKTNQLGRS